MSNYEHMCFYETNDGKIMDVYFDYNEQKSVEFERVDIECYILNELEDEKYWQKYHTYQIMKNHIIKIKAGIAVAGSDAYFAPYDNNGKMESRAHFEATLLSDLIDAEVLFVEQIKAMTKAEFKEKVEGEIFDCVFIKKDGSERKMLATTDMKKVPEEFHPKQKEMTAEEAKIKADKEEASPYVNVFDVEKNGWRKLDPAKLISLNIVG